MLLTPRLPYPALNGGEARIISLLRCLAGKYRFSLLTFLESGAKARGLAGALTLERSVLHKVHFVERVPRRLSRSQAWMPPYAQACRSPEMAAKLRSLLSEQSVDLVQIEFNEMAQYAREVRGKVPVVFTEHDVSILSRDRSYLSEARNWAGARGVWDWKRQDAYEREVLRHCDRVVLLTEADRLRLKSFTSARRLAVVPTGVDLKLFPMSGSKTRKPNTLVYVGHYPHYPNEDAVVFFCREILPKIARRNARVRLMIVGSEPTAPVQALASRSVKVTGAVRSIHPYLARAQIFVAPLRLGYGIKGKILEAFASGIPVVATPQACEGIPQARHGEHLLIAQTPESFSGQVRLLLKQPGLRRKLAKNARILVEKSFQWDQQGELLDKLYQSLLAPILLI